MATKMQSFRLTDEAIARLARLSVTPGVSQADVIADALFAYERAQAPPAQKSLLDVYDLVSDKIHTLQHLDEQRSLDPDEQEVLDFLNRVWDEARTLKLFTEPSLPPERWEKL